VVEDFVVVLFYDFPIYDELVDIWRRSIFCWLHYETAVVLDYSNLYVHTDYFSRWKGVTRRSHIHCMFVL